MSGVYFDDNGLAFYRENDKFAGIPIEGYLCNERPEKCDVLFILKEPHSRDKKNPDAYQKDAWLKESGGAEKYRERLSQIVEKLYPNMPKEECESLRNCAYINIRPQFGYGNAKAGGNKSYDVAFKKAKKEKRINRLSSSEIEDGLIDFENIKKAIFYFKPKKIVCCGCFDSVATALALKPWNTAEKSQKYQSADVYYAYHPAYTSFSKCLSFFDC